MTTTTTTRMVTTATTRRSMQTKSRSSRNSNGVLLFATMLILAIFSFSANTNTLFVSANTELKAAGECTYKKVYHLVKESKKKKKDIDMCTWLAEVPLARRVNMCNKKVVRKKNGKRKKMYKKIKVVQKKNGKRKEMSYWKACRCTCMSAYRAEANESNVPTSAPSESPNDGFTDGNTDPGVCPKKYIETPTPPTPTENPEPDTLYASSECSSKYEDNLTCNYDYTWDGCTEKTSQCRPVVSCTCNESDGLWTCTTETRELCATPSPTQAPRTPRPTQVPIERKNKSLLRTLREHTVVRNENKNHYDTTGEEEEHLRRDLIEESAYDKNGKSCPSPSPA